MADNINAAGRNLRSVWTIPSAPFPDAHFATFAPALASRCILAGTSARGCCPACGTPWARVTTNGWQPSCYCDAGPPVPCTVLDPFAGSGTVGAVAEQLGRHSILIELSPAYVRMAEERTAQRGLFAQERG